MLAFRAALGPTDREEEVEEEVKEATLLGEEQPRSPQSPDGAEKEPSAALDDAAPPPSPCAASDSDKSTARLLRRTRGWAGGA
mmetsp:Transcript_102601/g.295459  ORF Transcript_102601/g.295459 Transcript_102601/m.295459 type:complete len:83 (+) Transcript_102601:103-351(+)